MKKNLLPATGKRLDVSVRGRYLGEVKNDGCYLVMDYEPYHTGEDNLGWFRDLDRGRSP